MDVFDLVAKISIDSSDYEAGLKDAGDKSKSFGSSLSSGLKTAAKVGAAALTAVTGASVAFGKSLLNNANELADYGDNIDKMSQKMGISAQAYQEWDAILQHSGTSIDSMSRGMQTLQKNAVNSADKFKKLGITEKQIASMSTEELFSATIKGLQEMGEGAERTALASELLGGSAKELGALLNTSAEDTEKMRQRVHELGGVMSDEAVKASAQFKDNLQDLQTAISGIKKGLTSDFLPAISDLMDGFTKLLAGEEGAEKMLDQGMDKLGQAIDKVIPRITNLLETLLPRVVTLGGEIIGKLAEQLPKIITAVARQIPGLIKTLVKAVGKAAPELIKAGADLIKELADGMGEGDDTLIDAIMEALDAIFNAIIDNLDTILDAGMKILDKLIDGLLENLPKIADAVFAIIQRLGEAIIEKLPDILEKGVQILEKLIQGIIDNLPKIIKAAFEVIKALAKALIDNLPQIIQAGIQLIVELAKGIFEALPDLIAQIPQIIIDIIGSLLSPEGIGKLLQAGWDILTNLLSGIFEHLGDVAGTVGDLIEAIMGAVIGAVGALLEIGGKIVGFILDGIKQAWDGLVNWVESGIEALLGDVNAARDEALAVQAEIQSMYEGKIAQNKRYADTYGSAYGYTGRESFAGSNSQADIQIRRQQQQNADSRRNEAISNASHYTQVNVNVGGNKVDTLTYQSEQRRAKQGGGYN